jgi:hypothetical protein
MVNFFMGNVILLEVSLKKSNLKVNKLRSFFQRRNFIVNIARDSLEFGSRYPRLSELIDLEKVRVDRRVFIDKIYLLLSDAILAGTTDG